MAEALQVGFEAERGFMPETSLLLRGLDKSFPGVGVRTLGNVVRVMAPDENWARFGDPAQRDAMILEMLTNYLRGHNLGEFTNEARSLGKAVGLGSSFTGLCCRSL